MIMKRLAPAAVAPGLMAITLAGCGSIGAIGLNRNSAPAAPADTVAVSPVQSSNLPPVAGAAPPGQSGIVGAAPATTAAVQPPAASALGRTDLLGGWTIVSSGDSCQLFMTLTSWTGGYRASTRGCSSEVLKSISAWNLSGARVVLAGTGGSPVATLAASSPSRFDGQTGQGAPVSFYR
jgi:Protease inhibitor Inh